MAATRDRQDAPLPRDGNAPGRLDARAQMERLERSFARKGRGRWLWLSAIGLVWLLALAYYALFPPVYVSKWSLIVPASNSGSSVTLDTIGQASTTPSQPFGTVTLSPKAIYREIANSDQVRDRAARAIGISPQQFGRARIRLIDETSLLIFQINGSTAEQAQAKGRALIDALGAQLDHLRRDEFEKRAALVRDNLKLYQANLDVARERILAFQRETGMQSTEQFTEASNTAESIRRRLAERRADLDKVVAEQRRLVARIGLDSEAAAVVLRLAADPAFSRMATAYAEGSSSFEENSLRFGPRHPAQIAAQLKRDGALAEISKIARRAKVSWGGTELERLVMFVNGSEQSAFLRSVVAGEASASGLNMEIKGLEREALRLDGELATMGPDAARLGALQKDLVVAEAVYSSASARLDTNRSDLFSSYPMVQVLADPELPESRAQPRLLYALAAGLLGTLFILLAWGATWLRTSLTRTRSRSV